MADDHHRLIVQTGNATDNRRIVGEMPITVQFIELGEDVLDVIQGVRALRMARQTGDLPAAEVTENAFGQRRAFVLQTGNFVADVQRIVVTDQAQLFDLGLQVGDWLFEIEKIRVHKCPSCVDGQAAGELYLPAPYLKGSEASRSIIKRTAQTDRSVARQPSGASASAVVEKDVVAPELVTQCLNQAIRRVDAPGVTKLQHRLGLTAGVIQSHRALAAVTLT